jgi:cell division protease FtsH
MIEENMDILHAMKDALMLYETIDSRQIEDLMARRPVRQPENWEPKDKNKGSNSDDAKPAGTVTPSEPSTDNPL